MTENQTKKLKKSLNNSIIKPHKLSKLYKLIFKKPYKLIPQI